MPDEFAAVDVATRTALIAADEADAWDAATRAGVLAWIETQQSVLTVLRGKVVSAEQAAGTWGLKGDRDVAGFVGRVTRQGRGAGLAAVGQAATLAALPVVADAVAAGPVTARHLDEITRASAASPLLAAELASPAGQAQVVQLAGRLDGAAFGRRLRQMSAALDPASRQREHDRQRAERFLHLTHTLGGTLIKGRLDSVAGYKFAKAIDALNPRPALDDMRDRGQRQADALTNMAERILTDETTTPGALAPVQAVITLSQDTWAALRATRQERRAGATRQGQAVGTTCDGQPADERRRVADAVGPALSGADGTGSTCDVVPEPSPKAPAGAASESSPGSVVDVVGRLRGVTPVLDEDGRAWPASEIARALCDCALTRAVTDATGQTLDLGRSRRLFTQHHWLALLAAGHTTCVVDGCAMPLRYCELHHLTWWGRDGGKTTQANCVPLCSFHHHQVHRLDLYITRHPDGSYQLRYPDGRPYGGSPDEHPDSGSPNDCRYDDTSHRAAIPRPGEPFGPGVTLSASDHPPDQSPRKAGPPEGQPDRAIPREEQPALWTG